MDSGSVSSARLILRHRFFEPPQRRQEIKRIADANQRRDWVDRHGRLKMTLRRLPVEFDSAHDQPQHAMRLAQASDRLPARFPRRT